MATMATHEHLSHPAGPGRPDLASALRSRGLRMTPQREQVLAAVREMRHATPEQIADAVPGVDLTTVYRTLDLLEQLGLVRHAHLQHGAPSYRPGEDDHIHVVCHSCGRVRDEPATLAEPLAAALLAQDGFVVDRAHLTVFGRCGECAAAGATAAVQARLADAEQIAHPEH
jgi:Fur family ferric uptake transcriptional regulator